MIRQRARELAEADLNDGERVQKLLYQLHVAIARHFAEAELMVTSAWDEAPPRRKSDSGATVEPGHGSGSRWALRTGISAH